MLPFCPGYASPPFAALVADYPDRAAYPPEDFRVEWGPIFHRGRLDGSARVIVLGQDPGQHENVLRRILVGEAGRRVQGFLAKLGITRSYVMLNALLYSVYGSGGAKYVASPGVRDYRERWLSALLAAGEVEAVVTFGGMAERAFTAFAERHATLPLAVHLVHPTFPESAGGTAAERAANTKKMLTRWNEGLSALRAALQHPDERVELVPYGDALSEADRAAIPRFDLPAGTPAWMFANDGWAQRVGETPLEKRRTIRIVVPRDVLP